MLEWRVRAVSGISNNLEELERWINAIGFLEPEWSLRFVDDGIMYFSRPRPDDSFDLEVDTTDDSLVP